MRCTKASDRILMPTGGVMTLGEALDQGTLKLQASLQRSRNSRVKVVLTAWDGELGWPIGRMLYVSRASEAELDRLEKLEFEARRLNEAV